MTKRQHKRRFFGQGTTEYAVLLAIVATALIAMQIYLRRGIQGRIRDMSDQISAEHYVSGRTTSEYTTTQDGTVVQKYESGVSETYQDGQLGSKEEITTRSGNEKVLPETR